MHYKFPTGNEADPSAPHEADQGRQRGVPQVQAKEGQGGHSTEGAGTQAHGRDQQAQEQVRRTTKCAQGKTSLQRLNRK